MKPLKINFFHRLFRAYSLVEIIVVASLLVAIAVVLVPVLGKIIENTRFTTWQSISQSIQSDPRVALYFNFEDQEGIEGYGGQPVVENRSYGDASGLLTDQNTNRGAIDPSLRYGVLSDSHPDDPNWDPAGTDPIPAENLLGALPAFEQSAGRFDNKTAMRFFGGNEESSTPGLNSAGSYITTPNWAGIVDGGEFQLAAWVKLEDTGTKNAIVSWGFDDAGATNRRDYFAVSGRDVSAGLSDHTQLEITSEDLQTYEWGDDDGKFTIFDNQWHLIVLRLEAPYDYSDTGTNSDQTIAEMDDIRISVDGSDFYAPSQFYGTDAAVDRMLRTNIDTFVLGAATQTTGAPESGYIRGYIDELIIWQETTSLDEISRLMRSAPSGMVRAPLE